MKKTGLLLVAILVAVSAIAAPRATESKDEFGLGFILGEPSGINAQLYWGPYSSVSLTAAWSIHDWFFFAGDYQIINRIADSPPEWRWFYGLGGYIGAPENERGLFGVRVPLGIKYKIPKSVVDVWGEIVPALRLVPDTKADVQGGIGVTFWIK